MYVWSCLNDHAMRLASGPIRPAAEEKLHGTEMRSQHRCSGDDFHRCPRVVAIAM